MDQTDVINQEEAKEGDLVLKYIRLGKDENISIALQKGITGRKTIELRKSFRTQNTQWKWKFVSPRKLLVPDDIYNFVRALDRIIVACDGKKFIDPLNANEELASEEIITNSYDISLVLFRNEKGRLFLKFLQKRKENQRLTSFYISSNSLLWIREIIAQILEEHDGSEKLSKLPIVDFPFIYGR